MREKRRPSLDELKNLPVELWRLEAAQISEDALTQDDISLSYEADALMDDPNISPEKIVELREKLRSVSGSTEQDGGTGCTRRVA